MRPVPREGWILAGTLDGAPAAPALDRDVAGVPYLLRLGCELALAGVTQIIVVWAGDRPAPDVAAVARDPRLASRATVTIARAPVAAGDPRDPIVVVRADRVFHRDVPRQAIAAWRGAAAAIGKVAGAEYDAVVVTERAIACRLAAVAGAAGGLAAELARHAVATSAPPYLGFTVAAPDRAALDRAERQLVWSLRKAGDGIASRLINRRLSLPITWSLRRTGVRPNQVTGFAFACAVAGGIVLARGGYAAGVAGMLLVELGSIIDGVDGELARLRFEGSGRGQWLDTIADDLGNVCYATGIAINLHLAGSAWAGPLAAAAVTAFASTQLMQYYLIARVYRSGDLAAIPWAFQSTELLSQRPVGAVGWIKSTVPRLFKRDFLVTMFAILAVLGRLDLVLLVFSGGGLVFFTVFWVQCFRYRKSIHVHRTAAGVGRPTVVHAGD